MHIQLDEQPEPRWTVRIDSVLSLTLLVAITLVGIGFIFGMEYAKSAAIEAVAQTEQTK